MPHCSKVFILVKRSVQHNFDCLNSTDVYKLPAEPVDSNMARSDHEHKLAFLCPAHAKQHASLDLSLVGTDHGLATAMIIGRRVDFPGATTPFSINCCYQKHLATLRFDKVYMYARDNNCRMTSKKRRGREFTRNYGGRKGRQRKHLQLARASKRKSRLTLKVPPDIRR